MGYKFEKLDVWQRALGYIDQIHEIAEQLPKREQYNLAEQMTRAANSIALNIAARRLLLPFGQGAEGSTGLSDAEQDRFLRIATRSLLDIVCVHLLTRCGYLDDSDPLRTADCERETLLAKPQAFRSCLDESSGVQESPIEYDEGAPF